MAPTSWPRIIAAALPGPVLAWLLLAFAATHTDAVRMHSLASGGVSPDDSAGLAVLASGSAEAGDASETDEEDEVEAELEQRQTVLKLAAEYVDAIDIDEPMSLSEIRDMLYRLDDFNTSLSLYNEDISIAAHAEVLESVDPLLRIIHGKRDVLTRLAAQKESEGEVDDGGEVLPSERDNICNTIEIFDVEEELREDVTELCEALDTIRLSPPTHLDAERKVFEMAGRFRALDLHPEYDLQHISHAVGLLLAQEARWISRHVPEGRDLVLRALKAWKTGDGEEGEEEKGLPELSAIAQGISLDENQALSVVRTNLYRLETLSGDLDEYMTLCTDDDMCAQAKDLSSLIGEKYDALAALAEKKEAAGEGDEVAELFPSKRNNICKHVDEYGLDAQAREEVMHMCESLDRWREARLAEADEDVAMYEVSGRLAVLKDKSGYTDAKVVSDLEKVWIEEWRWRDDAEPGSESGSESGSEAE